MTLRVFLIPILLYCVFWYGGHICGVVCILEVHVAMYHGLLSHI